MAQTGVPVLIVFLSALAGAVHVFAPDHWLPASVLVWQRGWGITRTVLFSIGILLLHVLLGAGIYFCLDDYLVLLAPDRLLLFTLILVFAVTLLRVYRFSRVREVLRAGPRSIWGIFAVISLLGPCESIIPILIKAHHLGVGYLTPFLAFLGGTVVAGAACVLAGKSLWNQPQWLPRGIGWAHSQVAVLPIVAGLMLGMSAILRISG